MSINKEILVINLDKGDSWSGAQNKATLDISIASVVNEKKLEEAYAAIKDKTYTPTKKDKLYIYPNCTVPRFKIREMWKLFEH